MKVYAGTIYAANFDIIAQVVAELVDTEVFSAVYRRSRDVTASLVSNFAGTIVDSILFGLIAFWGALPLGVVVEIIVSNVLIKLAMSLLSAPTIRWIPRTASPDEM